MIFYISVLLFLKQTIDEPNIIQSIKGIHYNIKKHQHLESIPNNNFKDRIAYQYQVEGWKVYKQNILNNNNDNIYKQRENLYRFFASESKQFSTHMLEIITNRKASNDWTLPLLLLNVAPFKHYDGCFNAPFS